MKAAAPFVSIDEAATNLRSMAHSLYPSPRTSGVRLLADVTTWVARSASLPWTPAAALALVQEANATGYGGGTTSKPLFWLTGPGTLPAALAFWSAMFTRGLSPTTYMPKLQMTPLGYTAFAKNAQALAFMLRHTSPPESRLTLLKEHLSVGQRSKGHEGNTLLHRLLNRAAGSSGNEGRALLKCVQRIIAHDPDAPLCQNSMGRFPDSDLISTCPAVQCARTARLTRQAALERATLSAHVSTPTTHRPHKM